MRAFLIVAVLVLGVFCRDARSAPVAGGGSPASDCFLTFDPGAASVASRGSRTTIECLECDPACDADVGVRDGRCVLRLDVCAKQPATEACDPATALAGVTIVGATPLGSALDGSAAVCLPYEAEATLRRRGARELAGTRTIKLKAVTDGRPRRKDKDIVRFRCLPRSDDCPGTVTTSTVTSSTATTRTGSPPCGASTAPACSGRCGRRGERCLEQAGVCACVTLGE
jgi:hypothetical protein